MMHAGKMDLDTITMNAVDLMSAGIDTVIIKLILLSHVMDFIIQYSRIFFTDFKKFGYKDSCITQLTYTLIGLNF